jgi:hypothetical protein
MIYPDGRSCAQGYSGHGAGLNNPDAEAQRNVGPIPAGMWTIDPRPLPPGHLGPLALALRPDGFDPHGRSLFRIHGDTAAMNHTASDGCIILGHDVRQAIVDSGVTRLQVVHG